MHCTAHRQLLLNIGGLTTEQVWFLSLNIGIATISIALIAWLIFRSFRIHQLKSIDDLKISEHRHIQRIHLAAEENVIVETTNTSTNTSTIIAPKVPSSSIPSKVEPEEFHAELSEYYRLLETFDLTETEGFELEEALTEEQVTALAFPASAGPVYQLVLRCLQWNKFLSFSYDNQQRIIRPLSSNGHTVRGYCYYSNTELDFQISQITAPKIRDNYAVLRVRNVEPDALEELMDQIIAEQKPIRIRYIKPGQKSHSIDPETWELTTETGEPQSSLRTIIQFGRAPEVLPADELVAYDLDDHYIHGFCLLRNQPRTFKIDRIQSLEVLNS